VEDILGVSLSAGHLERNWVWRLDSSSAFALAMLVQLFVLFLGLKQ